MRSSLFISFLATLFMASFAIPASAAPLEGSWRGSGFVNPKSGNREKVRCKMSYKRESTKVFRVTAVCASPSAKIRQTGELLKINPNLYVGDFYNGEYDISGRVRVILNGHHQTVSFSSPNGSGRITLKKH